MKTPTLILRLLGFYFLTKGAMSLYLLYQIKNQLSGMPAEQKVVMAMSTGWNSEFAMCSMIILGLAATFFAGPLAVLLTFDSRCAANASKPEVE